MAAARTKDTYLSAQYHRLAGRRGKRRARKAVGHSILVACFHILAGGVPFHDLGSDHFERLNPPAKRARRHLSQLRALGYTVTAEGDHLVITPPAAA
jgi:hypothetical protein